MSAIAQVTWISGPSLPTERPAALATITLGGGGGRDRIERQATRRTRCSWVVALLSLSMTIGVGVVDTIAFLLCWLPTIHDGRCCCCCVRVRRRRRPDDARQRDRPKGARLPQRAIRKDHKRHLEPLRCLSVASPKYPRTPRPPLPRSPPQPRPRPCSRPLLRCPPPSYPVILTTTSLADRRPGRLAPDSTA